MPGSLQPTIDMPVGVKYYLDGGILHTVLRKMVNEASRKRH